LYRFQSTSGAFQTDFGFGPFDDFFTTVQTIPAAAGKAYPYLGRFEAASLAIGCLATLQDPISGGWEQFASFGVDAGGTSRAIQAIAAVGEDPQSPRWTTVGGIDAYKALENLTPAYLTAGRGGRVGIVMQGIAAAGKPEVVEDFAGFNLFLSMTNYLSPTGEYDSTAFGIFSHAEAMLGLKDVDLDVDPSAVAFLLNSQTDGNWGSDDQNGIALKVLDDLDMVGPVGSIRSIQATQLADSGWGFGGSANPSTTSEVVQGLVAQGNNPFDPTWSEVISGVLTSSADIIVSQQLSDGCWPNLFGPGNDPFATTDAVLLLTQEPEWFKANSNLPFVVNSN